MKANLISNKKIFLKVFFLCLTIAVLFIISGFPSKYLFRILNSQPKDTDKDVHIKPASELFLNNKLINKVYAGRHMETTFAENNDPFPNIEGEVSPIRLNDEISGCSLFPISWPDEELDSPENSGQIVATFTSYDEAAAWVGGYFSWRCYPGEYDEPEDTYLDIQYYDEAGEIEQGAFCPITGGGVPCPEREDPWYYLFDPSGLPTENGVTPTWDDGYLQTLGDDTETVDFEGVYALVYSELNDPGVNEQPPNCLGDNDYYIIPLYNNPPVANAGSDQNVNCNTLVQLDGTNSSDPNISCQDLTYSWEQTDSSGYSVTLDDSTDPSPAFTAPRTDGPATLTFQLTVSDGQFEDTNEVEISITCELEEPFCGDSILDDNEECDDGNTTNGDGCNSLCELEEDVITSQCYDNITYDITYDFGQLSWWDDGTAPPTDINCTWEQVLGSQNLIFTPPSSIISANSDLQYPLSSTTSVTFERIPSNASESYGVRVICGDLTSDTLTFQANEIIECCLAELPNTSSNNEITNLHIALRLLLGLLSIIIGIDVKYILKNKKAKI